MNKFLVVFLCLFSASKAEAQTTANAEAKQFERFVYAGFEPQLNIERGEDGKVGVGDRFGAATLIWQKSRWLGVWVESYHGVFGGEGYGETVVGPSFNPMDNLLITVGVGVENVAPHGLRGRINAYYEPKSGFVYAEIGLAREASWINIDAVRMFGRIGFGGILQMPDSGAGPKVEIRLLDSMRVWYAPVYDWEHKKRRMLVGMRIMFEK